MTIWALADLHLAISTPDKSMEIFGPGWQDYHNKIQSHWKEKVKKDDIVLLPGDISWAMDLESAKIDLDWLDALPGTKVLLKGNHDYWWPSSAKLKQLLPSSITFIHNNAIDFDEVSIGGTRLWDSDEYRFDEYIDFIPNPDVVKAKPQSAEQQKQIFNRELQRLELSLSQLNPEACVRIAMTHYPPIGADLQDSQTSKILEKYHIDICIFGHLHNVKKQANMFGEKNNIRYIFVAGDHVDFYPVRILG